MLKFFGLFTLTFIVSLVIHIGVENFIVYVQRKLTGTKNEEEETEEEETMDTTHMLHVLGIAALTVVALLVFAVVPAIGKGGLSAALLSGLIFTGVVEGVSYGTNIPHAKLYGVKKIVADILIVTISNLAATAAAYGIAVVILT